MLSGTGIRVEADRPVFDAGTATLFDPLDENSFAYLLPLSSAEALLESASFGPAGVGEDRAPLLRYLRTRHPDAGFTVTHSEYGAIPLGFAPPRTAGPRHILIGAKRGLIKPSAGYGVVRIAQESERLGRLWRQHRPLSPSRRAPWPWGLLDMGFVRLAAQDPRLPLALLSHVMRAIPSPSRWASSTSSSRYDNWLRSSGRPPPPCSASLSRRTARRGASRGPARFLSKASVYLGLGCPCPLEPI